jgi:hypothetical protein
MKETKTMRGQTVPNHMRIKDKESQNSIDSATHNQILKQLNGNSHHIPININTQCQQTQLPHQKSPFGKQDFKGRSNNLLFAGDPSHDRCKHWLGVKG